MVAFEHALILLLLIASLSVVGRWLPWPPLITYLLGGVGAALVPAFPRLELDPGFFFLCFFFSRSFCYIYSFLFCFFSSFFSGSFFFSCSSFCFCS